MTSRRAIILKDGNYEEISDTDNLVQVVSSGLTVKNSSTTVNNVDTINIKGIKGKVEDHLDSNKGIITFLAAGASTGYNHVNPYIRSNDTTPNDKVDINPWQVMLPDKTIQKQSSSVTIDVSLSGDREGTQTRDSNTWYYIYVTDETGYSNKAFFSKTKPGYRGFHPTLNAKFIGSCFLDGSSYIRHFFKHGLRTMYKDRLTAWTGNPGTGLYNYTMTNDIPPITNSYIGHVYHATSGYYGRVYEPDYATTARNWFTQGTYVYNFANIVTRTENNRVTYLSCSGSQTVYFYVCGYLEDPDNPLQHIT